MLSPLPMEPPRVTVPVPRAAGTAGLAQGGIPEFPHGADPQGLCEEGAGEEGEGSGLSCSSICRTSEP